MHTHSGTERAMDIVEERRLEVETALKHFTLPAEPALLYDPIRYVLDSGGKRLRPVMLLLSAEAFDASSSLTMPAALAVEIFHNFTLVHDDIMDHADTRRGRPTVHVKWDVGTALLSGDYMVGLSYDLLSQVQTVRQQALFDVFHRMVRKLCEGQALDKSFETREAVSVDQYIDMIDRKTGALLAAVFQMGGILGGAGANEVGALEALGLHVGRAFQIQDDLLDLTAPDAQWGKTIGGDLVEGKKAYLLLRALETATGSDRQFFASIVSNRGLDPEKISLARRLMEQGGILEDARQAVIHHTREALDKMHVFPESPATEAIRGLVLKLQKRIH